MDTPEQIKIWQHASTDVPSIISGLTGLAANAFAEAAFYGALANQTQGLSRKILLQLQEDEQRHAHCLKGIYFLVTGTPMQVAAVPPKADRKDISLRKSYGRSLKALSAYSSRVHYEEYGTIFGKMAAKEQEHCAKIAELIGLLGV